MKIRLEHGKEIDCILFGLSWGWEEEDIYRLGFIFGFWYINVVFDKT